MFKDAYGNLRLQEVGQLWHKVNYKTDLSLVCNRIYEYDLASANTSSLKESGALDMETILRIESMDKAQRNVTIGVMIREDKSKRLQKAIAYSIMEAKRQLFEANDIQPYEVLGIKNDAIFIIGRKLKYTKFGEMKFRVKESASIYYTVAGIEFYYNRTKDELTIKGINESVYGHLDHVNGMLMFFREVFRYVCLDNRDGLRKYLLKFVSDYKNKRLPPSYYREFNQENIFRTAYDMGEFSYNVDYITEVEIDNINPIYNYKRFILPIIRQFI